MPDRRRVRVGLKVIHRHRVAGKVSRRVSELVFVDGRPKAVLAWIDLGGVRAPLYICELDPERLRPAKGVKNTYHYDDTTVDPRFVDEPGESVSDARR